MTADCELTGTGPRRANSDASALCGVPVLFVSTVAIHAQVLHLPWVRRMVELEARPIGVASDMTSSTECRAAFASVHDVPFSRNPLAPRQFIETGRLLRGLVERYDIKLVHVQTPVAGFLTRLALDRTAYRKRVGMVYTAHGFHFFKGGGFGRNAIFRACERIAARSTDALCTVNREDYEAAQNFTVAPGGTIELIPGTGIDCEKFKPGLFGPNEIEQRRAELGLQPHEKLALMVAEFIPRKRHVDALRAFRALRDVPLVLGLVGNGRLFEECRALAKSLGIADRCRFLNFCNDVPPLLAISDVLWLPSEQEGLPACVMEAMAMERPIVAADTRGSRDLLTGGCGLVHPVGDYAALANATRKVLGDPDEARAMGRRGRARIVKSFSVNAVFDALESIYAKVLERKGLIAQPGPVRSPLRLPVMAPARLQVDGARNPSGAQAKKVLLIDRNGSSRPKLVILGAALDYLVRLRGPLIKSFIDAGLQVIGSTPPSEATEMARRAEILDPHFRYEALSLARTGLHPIHDLLYMWRLWRFLRRERPQYLFTCNIKPIIYGQILARVMGVPHRVILQAGLGYAFASGSVWHHRLVRKFAGMTYKWAFTGAELLVVQNPDDLQVLRRHGLAQRVRRTITVAGSGVDLTEFPQTAPPAQPVTFLLMARLLRCKGVAEFHDAARLLKQTHPTARFMVLGSTEGGPQSVPLAQIRRWQRDGSVEFVGAVVDPQPYLHGCSVFVLPTYYNEGCPRSILEALAVGRPVITTNWPGCRETICQPRPAPGFAPGVLRGTNGFLVPIRDVSALKDAMEFFLRRPESVAALGTASRRWAEERFDVHQINRAILEAMGVSAVTARHP